MSKPVRRVIKKTTKIGRTLAKSKIYQLSIIILATLAFLPTAKVESQVYPDTSYPLTMDYDGTKFVIKRDIVIEKTQSNAEIALEQKRQAEREAAIQAAKRRTVLARESTQQRYQVERATADQGTKRQLVQAAAASYNIPWQVLEAVWQVETGKSWNTNVRSYAGATGPMQFMPGTWRGYGVDANGDGRADITCAVDAVYSGARYLAANGANRGQIQNALFRYNHSQAYVNKVLSIARSIGYEQ